MIENYIKLIFKIQKNYKLQINDSQAQNYEL